MNVKYGNGRTKYGPGVSIELTGDEIATAIDAWLVTHGIHVSGPRTITVNGQLCEEGHVYIDPSGVVSTDGKKLSGQERREELYEDPGLPIAQDFGNGGRWEGIKR